MSREIKSISPSQELLKFRNGTQLVVSPFAGAATQWTNDTGSFRAFRLPAEEDTSLDFKAAMDELDIQEQETIHLDVTGPGQLRAFNAGTGNDQIVIRPAKLPGQADSVKVVLYQDESGGISWHFPDNFFEAAKQVEPSAPELRNAAVLRVAAEPVFTIPTRTVEAQKSRRGESEPSHLRGPITKAGRKIFKILVVPIAAPLLAKPLEAIVGKIERKHRRDCIRPLTPDNYRTVIKTPFKDWKLLHRKRALLVVHGIFSSTEGMLSMLPKAAMTRMHQFYEGRTIAYDHLTVSKSPEENARLFLEQVKDACPQGKFEFDILCHSRGGIVSRTLAERGKILVPNNNCDFRKVYFVATPNRGSLLADPAHIVDMLDVFTNLLTNFPDGPVMYSIEVFLAIVKLLAFTAERSLPGLAAMGSKGYIKDVLNSGTAKSPAAYASSAANYEPSPERDNGFFAGFFANHIVDRVFTQNNSPVLNDLVVPRDGVHGANGHPSFPIEDALVYGDADHVWHTAFFGEPRTLAHINQHFGIEEASGLAHENVGSAVAGPVGAVVGALVGGTVGSIASGAAVDAMDNENTITGSGSGTTRDVDDQVSGVPGVQTGGSATGGPDTRGVSERAADAVTGDAVEFLLTGKSTERYVGGGGGGSRRLVNPQSGVKAAPARGSRPGSNKARGSSRSKSSSNLPILPIELKRDPHIDFHERVQEGVANDLIVRLEELGSEEQTELEDALAIALGAGETSVEVTAMLSAPGFDLTGATAKTMTIGRERKPKSEQATFRLKARHPGPEPKTRTIMATFFLRNSCIGSVAHQTCVIPQGYQGAWPSDGSSRSTGFAIPLARREDCDLIVNVIGQDDSGQPPFQIRLRSEIPGYEFSDRFVGRLEIPGDDLAAYLDAYYQPYIRSYPSDGTLSRAQFQAALKKWEEDFSDALVQLGKRLWQFLPQSFRTEYFKIWQRGAAPRSIGIFSDEMIFPWELVVPHETINDKLVVLEPLGIAHILGRWKPGLVTRPVPQNLPVRNVCVLNPKYASPNELAWTLAEVQALQKLFPHLSVVTPASLQNVKTQILNRDDIQLFHFSGHGQYDLTNSDLNELILEGGDTLNPIGFAGTKLCAESRPIIYLNACSVGSAGLAVGRMGGFAANFLDNGCSGVIAPYWPINDERAAKFSVSLYRRLKMGRPIGEALQQLRSENPLDPTFRAFSYFGDPWARLVFNTDLTD